MAVVIALILFLTVPCVLGQPAAARDATALRGGSNAGADANVHSTVCSMQDQVLAFWLEHGINPDTGGQYGTVLQDGTSSKPSDVGLVQTSRQCFAMYYFALYGVEKAATAKAADSLCGFMLKYMYDKKSGMFVWMVAANASTVTDSSISLMGQWFALHALAARALYHKTPAAKADALSLFRAVDKWAHDSTTGGYDETHSRPLMDAFALPGNKQGTFSKSTNAHSNAIMSLHRLHEATGDSLVKTRLVELLTLLCDKMTVGQDLYLNYDMNWKPVGSKDMPVNMLKYGQNLQVPWAAAAAVDHLKANSDISAAKAAAFTVKMEGVAKKVANLGYDPIHGGFYEYGLLPKQPDKSSSKLWFVQCEAINALGWLGQRTGNATYWEMLGKTLAFTESKLVDHTYGDMFESTTRQGVPIPNPELGLVKGQNWKELYHHGRMVVNVQKLWSKKRCTAM